MFERERLSGNLSRREFLKFSGAAGAGVLVSPKINLRGLADFLSSLKPQEQEIFFSEKGDIIVETTSLDVAIIKAGDNHRIVAGKRADLLAPVWNQRLSADGRLYFSTSEYDVTSFPTDGVGGTGTSAKAENNRKFSGVLAIGGFGDYGAAVQVRPNENRILIFEAYGDSHHQTSIFTTDEQIYWLGWAGKQGSCLYMVLEEVNGRNLYRLEPTFPDATQAKRDCYYSTHRQNDCMMKSIKRTERHLVRVLDNVQNIFVTLGNSAPYGPLSPLAELPYP